MGRIKISAVTKNHIKIINILGCSKHVNNLEDMYTNYL